MTDTQSTDVAVIGAGPAGLTTAYELSRIAPDLDVATFEGSSEIGGISRTVVYDGYRVDIGGHRFFTKIEEVKQVWHEILGDEFLRRPRKSRIFYRGKFYDYPLRIFNALGNIGAYESARIMISYLKWQVRPHKVEDNFEEWVMNRFGGRLYMHFFRSYTAKVWGIDPKHIQADWAAQRIKSMTLWSVAMKALTGRSEETSLIEEFDYPRHGPGQMWERCVDILRERGQSVRMEAWVDRIERDGDRVTALRVRTPDGDLRVEAEHFVNSMAVRDLIHAFDPPPPPAVVEAADRLKYRDFLIVALVLDTPDPFDDNWIYIHSDDVRVGRIQNFRSWSEAMVADPAHSSIGMEYFCNEGEDLWSMDDDALVAAAGQELEALGLARSGSILKGKVIRQKKAYPVYDTAYRDALDVVSDWLKGLENLQTVGRNGLHRYNNQDHSMLTGLYAARNITGATHDLWDVNVERSYHEEMQVPDDKESSAQDLPDERDESHDAKAA
ncbi:NAD(P)/FAD-dependent oxidoreductase [Jannaschia sp. LMIT008]|uniref:NAD(P)/FAD-dependent oxidoreductase n=1 Tax=Jannaschia maritima TaxID=3032585 RepID=UPI002811F0F5|nr:NAD(P)/FAD-dependent oxidoreductase [Jannaschia sp. LMIT008]